MAKQPKIGIVGHSRAGKTTFIAALQAAFSNNSSWEFGVEVGSSSEYILKLQSWLNEGYFPSPTAVKKQPNMISCFITNKKTQKRINLEILDPAGQIFSLAGVGDHMDEYEENKKVLMECDGVVVLFDSTISARDIDDSWTKIKDGLHKNPRDVYIGPRLAICFAKADEIMLLKRFRNRNAESWAQTSYWKKLYKNINGSKYEARWFFISAVGWRLGMPNTRVFVDARSMDEWDVKTAAAANKRASVANVPQVPDPAVAYFNLENPNAQNNPVDSGKLMKNFPIFTSPLRMTAHNFDKYPVTTDGVYIEKKSFDFTRCNKDKLCHGVHVGYGLYPRDSEAQNAEARMNADCPWNLAEPIIWLASMFRN